MKKILKKYFELILIGLTVMFLMIKPAMPEYGERISMLFFGSLSFYYLASAVLVFLDKTRIGRMMRLIYLFGLWAVSFAVISVMARTLLLQLDKELLVISISACVGTILFCWFYFRGLKEDDKLIFKELIQPLITRTIASGLIVIAFLVISNYAVYSMFGTHKNDTLYTEKIVNAYEHPDDSKIVNDFKKYDALVRSKK